MPGRARFPRPSPFIIAEAVQSGLNIPAIQIDPRFNFVRGAYIFASDIDKLSMSFKSWREPLADARDKVVIPSIKQNFVSQGRPSWKPLSPRTLQNRMYMGFGRGPILQRTSRLRIAATRKNIWEIVSAIGRDGADMLRLRTEYFDQLVPYGQFHQLGARLPERRTTGSLRQTITRSGTPSRIRQSSREEIWPTSGGQLPARPFIQLTLTEEIEIYEIFFSFMSKKVDQFWPPETRGREL
jgi:phage gpG-like protein